MLCHCRISTLFVFSHIFMDVSWRDSCILYACKGNLIYRLVWTYHTLYVNTIAYVYMHKAFIRKVSIFSFLGLWYRKINDVDILHHWVWSSYSNSLIECIDCWNIRNTWLWHRTVVRNINLWSIVVILRILIALRYKWTLIFIFLL